MERLPENLAFYKGFSEGWSNVPLRSDGGNNFFITPLFASKKAIQVYGRDVLLLCLAFLREQAKKLGGIDSFQIFWDMNSHRSSLLVIEDTDAGDRGVGIIFEHDRPLRTVALLEHEYNTYAYLGRYGDEWLNLKKVE